MERANRTIRELPRPGEKKDMKLRRVTYKDLIEPDGRRLQKTMEDLLDKAVVVDSKVTSF